ncbi:MAG: AI-2E family transporter [Sphingobacteriaceae bacterium]
MRSAITLPFYARLALVLICIITIGYLAILGHQILSPLLFSLLFAILLLPLANFFEGKCKLPRSLSTILSIIIMVCAIFLILYLITSQLSALANDWPLLKQQVNNAIVSLHEWIDHTFHINTAKQVDYMNDASNKILNASTTFIGATVLSISSIMLFLVFILIYTFFMLLYRRLLIRFLVTVFPEEYKSVVYDIAEQVKSIIKKYLIGLMLQACLVAGISCGVFAILGVKYALLLGLITGIFNIIPYIGIFTALLLSTTITFATAGLSHALFVGLAIVIIHLVDSNIMMPKIVGSKVKINPLIIVLGVVIGEMMWGISGMILSIPVLAILKIVFDSMQTTRPWGILLGDEEEPALTVKPVQQGENT